MSDIVKQVSVSKEVDALMGVIVDAVLAAKDGKFNLLGEISLIISHLGDFAALPEEIRNNQADSIEAVMLQSARLIAGLMGAKAGN